MSQATTTLFVDSQFFSPYAMSAFVVLREKGLAFEVTPVDLGQGRQFEAGFRKRSLTARVPTLLHGDFSLTESSAIAEYLEEMFPAPAHVRVFPATVTDRARARQIQAWLRSDLGALRQERPTSVVFSGPVSAPLSESARRAADKLIVAASDLLAGGRDSLFENWCIADTDLALMLNRLVLNGDPVPEALARYAHFQWQRPFVREWLARSAHRRPASVS